MKKITLALSLTLLLILGACTKQQEKPNILILLCDDLGYGDLSCYGHPTIQTPNIDQLAEAGLKLTDYYAAAPVCSPSRVGLLTGRSPNKAGVYDFIPGLKKVEDCRDMVHIQAHEQTLPAMLQANGYATCLSGKWHCSSRFNSDKQPQPNDLGFDYWFSTHNNAAPTHENPTNFVRNGEKVGEIKGFSCQIVATEAINWLESKDQDKPFYLQVCFHEPHEPIASPKDLIEDYLPKARNEQEAEYFANVANMDKAVGRIISYLKDKDLENTLVIFTSDNGPETLNRYYRATKSYGSPGELKGMKLWTSEAGFRVPCIMTWLDKKTPVGVSSTAVSALDLLPTFAELTGSELPSTKLDGQSILPLLQGKEFTREKPLIWCFYDALNDYQVAMRYNDWKITARLKLDGEIYPHIHNLYKGNIEEVKRCEMTDFLLYNLAEDKGETKDLSTQNPEMFEKMRALVEIEYKTLLDESFVWDRKE